MKIGLNMGGDQHVSSKKAHDKELERIILATKEGDWTAKTKLAKEFMPLLTSLAEKRTKETGKMNELIEKGKNGLYAACKKYKPVMGVNKFRVFAVNYIEKYMDGKVGFFSRLFGG